VDIIPPPAGADYARQYTIYPNDSTGRFAGATGSVIIFGLNDMLVINVRGTLILP
jgi:hypothetical protein